MIKHRTHRRGIMTLMIVAAIPLSHKVAKAGTEVVLGQKVATSRQVSIDQIRHDTWDRLLNEYVSDQGLVDYRRLKQTDRDLNQLDGYLAHLSSADPDKPASRASKLAYWINAYNAVTVRGILREYPTSSIRNHTPRLFGYHIWKDLKLIVGDATYSLDQMEHQVLRKMGEPKIHFAIVCASMGCPRLLDEAYRAETLQQQLSTNARHFFSKAENFRLQDGTVYLSMILQWFADDFGKSTSDVLRTIRPWLSTKDARQMSAAGSVRVRYLEYDWSLNEQSPP